MLYAVSRSAPAPEIAMMMRIVSPFVITALLIPSGVGFADAPAGSIDIVIAEHVLLWDGQIKTWEAIVDELRVIRKKEEKPLHLHFHFTNGSIRTGRNEAYQNRIHKAYQELADPEEMQMGNLSPRAGDRYDAIRTPADLIPRPEHIRTGIVRNASGRPVTVATVVLIPEDSVNAVVLRPNLSLRDPLDEIWTRTDKEGRFQIASPYSGYRLAVLSPAGFRLLPIPKSGEQTEIKLLPNAEIEFTSADESKQELSIGVQLPDRPATNPVFSIFEVSIGDEPNVIRVPPGKLTISRTFPTGQGRSVSIPAESFAIKAGEKKAVSLPPPDPDTVPAVPEDPVPLLAAMASDHGYGLAKGQDVCRVAPPFEPIRKRYYRAGHRDQSKAIPRGPTAFTFRWKDEQLQCWGMMFGGADGGYRLSAVIDTLVNIKSQFLEGPADLLNLEIPGDWVVRVGASEKQVIEQIEMILRDDMSLPVRLQLREVERQVYVASGTFVQKPLPGRPANDTTIEIYAKELVTDGSGGGGGGDFNAFLDWLGRWIATPIVSELKGPPPPRLRWHDNHDKGAQAQDHDPKLVLPNIAAQTSLTFSEEKRRVKILHIERD
jgi:hypothetical protein